MDSQLQEARYAGSSGIDLSGGGTVLNQTIYENLAGSMPAKSLHQMYAMCVNDVRKRIAAMRGLAAEGHGEEFVREAHSIKGACGMLGATELYGIAAELETSGIERVGTGGTQNISLLNVLAAACDRLERILRSRA
jgi:HPt (histidine-containing phosphotransfer) domain-containing protein